MSDILTEMMEQHSGPDELAAILSRATERDDAKQAAELALLKHLALEGELSLRRDQLAAEHQAVTQRLVDARSKREALVAAVKEAGGELPRWEV